MSTTAAERWHPTACILCSLNCGIETRIEDGHLAKIRGDKAHPMSQGYTCQKALRLDHYQNSPQRLTQPLRRRGDGSFEPVSWDTVIREIADRLRHLRDTYGFDSLAYYGGGGQGNHLGGAHASSLRAAMGDPFLYTALAQEKTGGFWVDGKLFGSQACHPTEDVENTDYLLVVGANPWQSHGFPRARHVLQEITRDPRRTLVVVDPRRTETAEKADIHLQVRPGGDAHLLLAMLATVVQEGLEDREFVARHTTDFDRVSTVLSVISVDEYAREAGVAPDLVRQVARDYAKTPRACIRTDLGLEHSLHSTLNTYLSKLLYLITGHFGRPGTNVFHTFFAPLIRHSKDPAQGGRTTRVTGAREIGGLFPPNVLPLEIDCDHPGRVRGVVVESSNPVSTGADTRAYQRAFAKLDLLVVVDVALTETARLAHYVLPAASQFEKWEATFFNLDFPANYFHLRHPLLERLPETLPEPEIHRRLAVAMGELPARFPILSALARIHRRWPRLRLFPLALAATFKLRPKLARYFAVVLHETIGAALPNGARAAGVLWATCQLFVQRYGKQCVERAGIKDEGAGHAEALFNRVLNSPSGTLISVHEYDDTWKFLKHSDRKIHLWIDEMIDEIRALQPLPRNERFPLILQAGERRSYNANTIYRDGSWRKQDADGSLKVHSRDARELDLRDGELAWCENEQGSICVRVQITDELHPGVVSLPHGYGMYRAANSEERSGPAINFLTRSDRCDDLSKVPFHKFVPVRVRPVRLDEAGTVGDVGASVAPLTAATVSEIV
jgi:anaerobic selenocysteine-containing dehydrogenase